MQNLCKSYLLERELGTHVWGVDQMKLALYAPGTVLDPDVITTYTATGEVSGSGYDAGGVSLSVSAGFPQFSPSGARKVLIDFDDILIQPASGFTVRYGLIYNASKGNKAVAVIDFATDLPVNSNFSVVWPLPDDNNCIIRLGA